MHFKITNERKDTFMTCQRFLLAIMILTIFFNGVTYAAPPAKKDRTPPTTPVVLDDGQFTSNTSQLHASWSSSDPESKISEYQYSIGTAKGLTNVATWRSAGLSTEATVNGLSLIIGQIYYFNVKAKNGAGLWSAVGYSDGITVLIQNAKINSLAPVNNSTFTGGDIINIVVQAQGSPPLEYRYLVNGSVIRDWTASNSYSWQTQAQDKGLKTIKAEVRAVINGSTDSSQANIFLYRKVPKP